MMVVLFSDRMKFSAMKRDQLPAAHFTGPDRILVDAVMVDY